jgi:PmbA protein
MKQIDRILDRCKSSGADMADVFNLSRRTLQIAVRDGQVETVKRASPGGLGIRFFKDGKMAFAHSTDISEAAVDAMIPRLAAMAQKTQKDPNAGMPSAQEYPKDLKIHDGAQLEKPIEEKIEYLRALEKSAMKFDPMITKSNGVSYDEIVTTRTLGNSKGVSFSFDSTFYRVGISVVATKGEEMFPGEGSMFATYFDDLPAPEEIVRYFASRAVRLIGGTPVDPGDYEIVFTPEAAGSLLWGLNFALNGYEAFKGSSFLAGKQGVSVAAGNFTVIDDALKPRGVSTRPVDDEGTASQTTVLIENGILKNYLYDFKAAAKAKTTSTGSAYRNDYGAMPEINHSNFYIAPGEDKAEDVVASLKRGIIVEQTQGWGLHSVTGQYSAGINGILVENGKRIRPVAGVTLAATAEEVLGGIDAVCDDIRYYWDMTSPSLMVKRMKVGA